jgi:glycerol-3-phosphate acyltransferase PlsY
MLKTALAIFITGVLLGFNYNAGMSLNDGYCYMAGLFAVVGHVFPIYYGFKGGKGVLVTATMALILTPLPFVFLLLIFIIVVALSKYVSLGSVTAAVLYPVIVNFYIKLLYGTGTPGILSLCTILLAIFIVWCHRGNLQRISDRTERKISFKKKSKELCDSEKETEGESDTEEGSSDKD